MFASENRNFQFLISKPFQHWVRVLSRGVNFQRKFLRVLSNYNPSLRCSKATAMLTTDWKRSVMRGELIENHDHVFGLRSKVLPAEYQQTAVQRVTRGKRKTFSPFISQKLTSSASKGWGRGLSSMSESGNNSRTHRCQFSYDLWVSFTQCQDRETCRIVKKKLPNSAPSLKQSQGFFFRTKVGKHANAFGVRPPLVAYLLLRFNIFSGTCGEKVCG